MVTKQPKKLGLKKLAVKKPAKMNYDKADKIIKQVIEENGAWLKEMAKR